MVVGSAGGTAVGQRERILSERRGISSLCAPLQLIDPTRYSVESDLRDWGQTRVASSRVRQVAVWDPASRQRKLASWEHCQSLPIVKAAESAVCIWDIPPMCGRPAISPTKSIG